MGVPAEDAAGEDEEVVIEILGQDVVQLQARGGAKVGAVSRRAGAEVVVEPDESEGGAVIGGRIRISGAPSKVAKATAMLKAMVAFSEAEMHDAMPCKWFAAGFCCRSAGGDRCPDGAHSDDLAQEVAQEWLAMAPRAPAAPPAVQAGAVEAEPEDDGEQLAEVDPYMLPVDDDEVDGGGFAASAEAQQANAGVSLEAGALDDLAATHRPGCGRLLPLSVRPVLLILGMDGPGRRPQAAGDDEIVELAVLAVCPESRREVGRFHRFTKPVAWAAQDAELRHRHPESCFNTASSAILFTDVLADLLDWVPGLLGQPLDSLQKEDLLFVVRQDSDMELVLPRQCSIPEQGTVDIALQNFLWCRWACLKDAFQMHFSLKAEASPSQVRQMLRHLRIPPQPNSKHSRCMRDVSDLSRITKELLRIGWKPQPSAWRDTVTASTQFTLRPVLSAPGHIAGPSSFVVPGGVPALGGFMATSAHGMGAVGSAATSSWSPPWAEVVPTLAQPTLAPSQPGTRAAMAAAFAAALGTAVLQPPPPAGDVAPRPTDGLQPKAFVHREPPSSAVSPTTSATAQAQSQPPWRIPIGSPATKLPRLEITAKKQEDDEEQLPGTRAKAPPPTIELRVS